MNIRTIPDESLVYRRVNKKKFNNKGQPTPAAFKPRNSDKGRLSVSWADLCTPEDVIQPMTEFNGCLSLEVGLVRGGEIRLIVEHNPVIENEAHSIIHTSDYDITSDSYADPDYDKRDMLTAIAKVVIPPS